MSFSSRASLRMSSVIRRVFSSCDANAAREIARKSIAFALVYTISFTTLPLNASPQADMSAASGQAKPLPSTQIQAWLSQHMKTAADPTLLASAEPVASATDKLSRSVKPTALIRGVMPRNLHPLIASPSTISSNFNGTSIAAGSYVWFNSAFTATGLGSGPVTIFVRSASVQFTANGIAYNLPVPDANITFSSQTTTATTTYDAVNHRWVTHVPVSGLAGNVFLSGLTFAVPAGGLPGGINPVSWSGSFFTDTTGVSLNWKWAAAAYSAFGANYNVLGIKPVDDNSHSQYLNSDHAGTPENYKASLVAGARGGGGSNYTGGYSGTAALNPSIMPTNHPPVANAGPAQTVYLGNTVQLNGTGSSDSDGNPITYRWSFVSIPTGSTALLTAATTAIPTFVVDKPGSYTAQLIVNDGQVDSQPSTVIISTQNSAPVAYAGPDQSVKTLNSVQLDGSHSSDVDGDPLSYKWTIIDTPAGSTATLSNATIVNPTFVADKKGAYAAQLIVNDGKVDSAASQVTISTINSAPVANAGPAQTIIVGRTVQLTGSGSTDVDGDALIYSWSLITVPSGSTATLSNPNAVNPTFVADMLGNYVAQLIVSDGTLDSTPSTVPTSTGNSPPTANPGLDQTVPLGSLVSLDGSASSDPDGQSLTYQWSLTTKPSGSTAVLSNATSANPAFTADKAGDYGVQLIVNDGYVNSQPATVRIGTINSKPVANAGVAQQVATGATVTLDGTHSSDADNDSLRYSWSLLSPAGANVILSNPTSATPNFVASLETTYVFQLIVNDGKVNSDPATFTVTAVTPNQAPVVNAGPNQTVVLPINSVTLDGSITDDGKPTGAQVTSQWTQISGSGVVTFNAASQSVTQAVFPLADTYVLRLTASDTQLSSYSDVTIIVLPSPNHPPVANAGPDQSVTTHTTVQLDGSHSSDADNDPLIYSWTMQSKPQGSAAVLSNAAIANPTFIADVKGDYIFLLAVNDGKVDSATPSQVTIHDVNSPPVANAGSPQTVVVGSSVQLNGSGSTDIDGDALTYAWQFLSKPAGSSAVIANPTAVNPTFTADALGDYQLQLLVNDGTVDSAPATVTISTSNSAPTANAGPDQTVPLGGVVTLDGSASSDPDGQSLTYIWLLTSVPVGSTAALTNPTSANPSFTAEKPGNYVAQLIVNDGYVNSPSATVRISTQNSVPVADAGPSQTVTTGATVTLDGTHSSDADYDPLTYIWSVLTQPDGANVALSENSSATPGFIASVEGSYVFQLIVNDGKVNSKPVTVMITAVLAPPSIDSITPTRAHTGDTITIQGQNFSLSPDKNAVKFSGVNGTTLAGTVTSATATTLSVVVSTGAVTGTVTLTTSGGSASGSVQIAGPAPAITGFTPNKGPSDTVVTIAGSALKADVGDTTVTFAGKNGTTAPATLVSATTTTVQVTVPSNAVSGPIQLSTIDGSVTTSLSFIVDNPQDFSVALAPSSTSAVQGSNATYLVTVTSPQTTFTQLAQLSISGLPSGVSAALVPPQIAAGETSTVTVTIADTVSPGTYGFTVTAQADADGQKKQRTASGSLVVLAKGQTTLAGRVLSALDQPIVGATVSIDGKAVFTDVAGNFLLVGINPGQNRPLSIDGHSATFPNQTYPTIFEPATIIAGKANVVPYPFRLPAVDTQEEVTVIQGRSTVAGNSRLPGLQMTIPAGANLRMLDGTLVTRVSITPLPPSRTPAPLPPSLRTSMVYTSQPGGAFTDIPIPVTYPNLDDIDPETRVELWAFDHGTVSWHRYGWGRVSNDGKTIVPEIDPSNGRPYGLLNFSWHTPTRATPDGNPCPDDCNKTDNPVDLGTGLKLESHTDVAFGGARGGINFGRVYNSDLSGFCTTDCPFGYGMTHSYDYRLIGLSSITPVGSTDSVYGAVRFRNPGEGTGHLLSYDTGERFLGSGGGGSAGGGGAVLYASPTTHVSEKLIFTRSVGFELQRLKQGDSLFFNLQGRLTSIRDRNNNTTTLTYSGNNLIQITDPVGRSITLTYDSSNRVTSVTDPLQRVWRYAYSGSYFSTVTDPLGHVTNMSIDGGGRLTGVTDARGNKVKSVTYDPLDGRVTKQVFADGSEENFVYEKAGARISGVAWNQPGGRTTATSMNGMGYAAGRSTSGGGTGYFFDRNLTTNFPVKMFDGAGNLIYSRVYDDLGNILSHTDRLQHTVSTEYNYTFDKAKKVTDALGRVTKLDYDDQGNLTSTTNSLNQVTHFGYDSFGQMTSVTDPLGHAKQMEYDGSGNLTAIVDALGHRTQVEYDTLGRKLASVDALGRRTAYEYDAMDRLITVTDASGAKTHFQYDGNGNRTAVIDALGNRRTMRYDSKNHLVAETDPIGRVTRYEYNGNDEVTAVISPSGRKTSYEYDLRGKVSKLTQPTGEVLQFTYTKNGDLLTLTDQRGNTSTYTYDELFRLTSKRDPLGQVSTISYDAAGNVAETIDRMGHHTTFSYDALNRVQQQNFADASVSFTYDAAGRRTRIDDSQSGSVEWAYDDVNRLLAETQAAGVVRYTYDAGSRRETMSALDRAPVQYGYDSAGRLSTISQGTETFAYGYDLLSRITSLQRPNGIATEYNYDAAGHIAQLSHGLNASIEKFSYTYSADDHLTSISSLGSAGLLPAEKPTSAADAADRIAQYGLESFGFDQQGHTTDKTTPQGASQYVWDSRGRLTQVVLPGGEVVSYAYDALGRRISRTANGLTTRFVYDGADVVLDLHNDGSTVDYLNGPGIDNKLRQYSAGTGSLYFLQDHLGSTIALTNVVGSVIERISYEAFGATTGSQLTRYLFTGREFDSTTGLYYLRARWYDPALGRFLSPDPLGTGAGSPNFYAYCLDNPLGCVDPSGQMGSPTFPESIIPIWGSGKTAIHDFQCGDWGWGLFNTAMAVSDIFLVKSLFTALGKVAVLGLLKLGAEEALELAAKESVLAAEEIAEKATTELAEVATQEEAEQVGISVYRILNEAGEVEYVGVTKDLVQRAAQHGRELEQITTGLTRIEARGVEQALIEEYGLAKNGGQLRNIINSIARSNEIYEFYTAQGRAILANIGYIY